MHNALISICLPRPYTPREIKTQGVCSFEKAF